MRDFRFPFGTPRQLSVPFLGFLCAAVFTVSSGCGAGNDASTPVPSAPGSGGSPAATIDVRDFGTVTLPGNASSQEFQIDVRGSSFMIIADGGRAPDIDINSVTNPLSAALVTPDPNDLDPIGRNTSQALGYSVQATLFPQTTTYTITPGLHRFTVLNFGSDTQNVKVKAIVNNRPDPSGGTLNINLVFCGIPDLSSATAMSGQSQASQRFLTILNEFKRIYALAHIQVAISGLFDCPAAEAARLTFIEPDDNNQNGQPDDLDELFALSANLPANALTYFFVQDPNGVAGISGGIPGPALTPGTTHSGVAVSTFGPLADLTQAAAVIQGQTMAHEGGHFLGLFHTTESGAQDIDPIPDTPACSVARDTNGNGTVDAGECLDLDGLNLMFWGPPASGTAQDILSAGQRFVLHRNPLIQ
jgi:Pregnancy-associated plasma protein-A